MRKLRHANCGMQDSHNAQAWPQDGKSLWMIERLEHWIGTMHLAPMHSGTQLPRQMNSIAIHAHLAKQPWQ
jgi:hypothetical protein